MGLARAFCDDRFVTEPLLAIQKELVTLMGEIGVAEEDRERYAEKGFKFVDAAMVDWLTVLVDDLEKHHQISYKH